MQKFEHPGGLPAYALVIIIFVSVVVVVILIVIVRKKRLPVTIKKAAPQPNAYEEAWDIKYNMTLAGALGGPQSPHNVGPKGDDYAMVSNAENKTTITVGPKDKPYSAAF
nr:hypothetical protein BaRGS_030406 [Batillaria attramentaria]